MAGEENSRPRHDSVPGQAGGLTPHIGIDRPEAQGSSDRGNEGLTPHGRRPEIGPRRQRGPALRVERGIESGPQPPGGLSEQDDGASDDLGSQKQGRDGAGPQDEPGLRPVPQRRTDGPVPMTAVSSHQFPVNEPGAVDQSSGSVPLGESAGGPEPGVRRQGALSGAEASGERRLLSGAEDESRADGPGGQAKPAVSGKPEAERTARPVQIVGIGRIAENTGALDPIFRGETVVATLYGVPILRFRGLAPRIRDDMYNNAFGEANIVSIGDGTRAREGHSNIFNGKDTVITVRGIPKLKIEPIRPRDLQIITTKTGDELMTLTITDLNRLRTEDIAKFTGRTVVVTRHGKPVFTMSLIDREAVKRMYERVVGDAVVLPIGSFQQDLAESIRPATEDGKRVVVTHHGVPHFWFRGIGRKEVSQVHAKMFGEAEYRAVAQLHDETITSLSGRQTIVTYNGVPSFRIVQASREESLQLDLGKIEAQTSNLRVLTTAPSKVLARTLGGEPVYVLLRSGAKLKVTKIDPEEVNRMYAQTFG